MKNVALIGIGAGIGVIIGTGCGYFIAKKKYENIMEEKIAEEVESVREAYRGKNSEKKIVEDPDEDAVKTVNTEKLNVVEYRNIIASHNYNGDGPLPEKVSAACSVVSPDEFGTNETYDTVSLIYTEDGYLLDEDEEPVEEPETYIGMDSAEVLTHFGEYEDDSVYVRNDDASTYYEILMSNKRYQDIQEALNSVSPDED